MMVQLLDLGTWQGFSQMVEVVCCGTIGLGSFTQAGRCYMNMITATERIGLKLRLDLAGTGFQALH